MIKLIKTCFHSQFQAADFQQKLALMVPTYGNKLLEDEKYLKQLRNKNHKILNIN
jgi:malate dehydrogenase (quinone)